MVGIDPVVEDAPLQSYSMIIMDMSDGSYKVIKPKKKRIRRKMKKSFGML